MLKWSPCHATNAKFCCLSRVQIGHEDVGGFDFEIRFDRPGESLCQHIHRADASFLKPFGHSASEDSTLVRRPLAAPTAPLSWF